MRNRTIYCKKSFILLSKRYHYTSASARNSIILQFCAQPQERLLYLLEVLPRFWELKTPIDCSMASINGNGEKLMAMHDISSWLSSRELLCIQSSDGADLSSTLLDKWWIHALYCCFWKGSRKVTLFWIDQIYQMWYWGGWFQRRVGGGGVSSIYRHLESSA